MLKKIMLSAAVAGLVYGGPALAQTAELERGVMPPEAAERYTKAMQRLKNRTYFGAVADSASTYIGLQAGAAEANPLVNTSAAGLIGLAVVKVGITEAVNRSSLPEIQKHSFNNNASALWTGVSINNLLVAASVSTPVAIGAGVLVGYLMWKDGREIIEAAEHERLFWEEGCPSIRHYSGNPQLQCVYTPPEPRQKVAMAADGAVGLATVFEAP